MFYRSCPFFLSALVVVTPNFAEEPSSEVQKRVLVGMRDRYSGLVTYDFIVSGDLQTTSLASGELRNHREFKIRESRDIGSGLHRYETQYRVLIGPEAVPFHKVYCHPGKEGDSVIVSPGKKSITIGDGDEFPPDQIKQIKLFDFRTIGLMTPELSMNSPTYEQLTKGLMQKSGPSKISIEETNDGTFSVVAVTKEWFTKSETIVIENQDYAPVALRVWHINEDGEVIDPNPFIEIITEYSEYSGLYLPVSSRCTDRSTGDLFTADLTINWDTVNQTIAQDLCSMKALGVTEKAAILKQLDGKLSIVKHHGTQPDVSPLVEGQQSKKFQRIAIVLLNGAVIAILVVFFFVRRRSA